MERTIYCVDCGKRFKSKARRVIRCPECRLEHKKIINRENYRRKKGKLYKTEPTKSINEIMRELKAYNKNHGTRRTYGQYVSLVEGE